MKISRFFWDKIAFRGILISRFRQIDEFREILISRFEQKIRISRSKQKMKKLNDLHVRKLCIFTYDENKLRRF